MREGVEGLVAPPEGYSPGQYYFDRDGRLIVSLKNQTATAYGALAALKKFPEICNKWADMKPEEKNPCLLLLPLFAVCCIHGGMCNKLFPGVVPRLLPGCGSAILLTK